MKRIVFLSVFLFFAAPSAFAARQLYTAQWMFQTVQACELQRSVVADDFAARTGLVVLGSACVTTITGFTDLQIAYESPTSLRRIGTMLRATGEFLEEDYGAYRTEHECNMAIPSEVAVFQSEVGLVPFLSYCVRVGRSTSTEHKFAMKIDAFGESDVKPQIFSQIFFDQPLTDFSFLESQLRQSLESHGISAPVVIFSEGENLHRVLIRFYAPRRLPLLFKKLATAGSESGIGVEQDLWNNSVSQLPVEGILSFITKRQFNSIWDLFGMVWMAGAFNTEDNTQVFSSWNECDANRNNMLASFELNTARNAVGALCTCTDELFRECENYKTRLLVNDQ